MQTAFRSRFTKIFRESQQPQEISRSHSLRYFPVKFRSFGGKTIGSLGFQLVG